MVHRNVKSLVALAAFTPCLLGGSSPSSQQPWRIVRHDYVEFCSDTTFTWDLHEGTLTKAKGACGRDQASAPTIRVVKLPLADVKQLRGLSNAALRQGIATQPCNTTVPVRVLSGPLSFTIEKDGRKVHSPKCMNDLGRRLEDRMAATIGR